MKIFLTVLLSLLISLNLPGQEKDKVILPKGQDHLATFDLHMPFGAFARSHVGGVGLSYSWSHHRFNDVYLTSKLIGFTVNVGGDYYFGRRTETAENPFRYGGYIYTYLMPGIMTNLKQDINISLTAGPTLGIYKGNADMGAGVNLFGNYFFEDKLSLGPGILYKKHPGADALWTFTVRLGYILGGK